MKGNDLFEVFPEFSNVVHTLAAIPATSRSAEGSYSTLQRLKNHLLITMGQRAHTIDSLERIFSLICRPMSVHRMTLVSFRLFRKNLGNLRDFFGKWFAALPGKRLRVRLCVIVGYPAGSTS